MTSDEATTLLQAELISKQRHEIAELKTSNRQLEADNLELMKVLTIALDNLKGAPLVISQARMAEIMPEFMIELNVDNNMILRVGGRNAL